MKYLSVSNVLISSMMLVSLSLNAYIPPLEQYELERAILESNTEKVTQGLKNLQRAGVTLQERKNLVAFLLKLSAARIEKGGFAWQSDQTGAFLKLIAGGAVGIGTALWAVSSAGYNIIQLKCDCLHGHAPNKIPYGPQSVLERLVSLGISLIAFHQAYKGIQSINNAEADSSKPSLAIHDMLKNALGALEK